MLLSPDQLIFFHERIQYFSTNKLHELDYYWRNNSTHPIDIQMHRMIKMVLSNRSRKSFHNKRSELIKHLEKSLSLSNSMGRLSARIIGYMSQFVELKTSDTFDK